MACRRQPRGWRFAIFRLALGCTTGLLTLLVATAAPASAASTPFALLARLAGLMWRRRLLAPPAGLVRGSLSVGRLLALLLTPLMPASILLRLTLILAVASAIALAVQLLRLRALIALCSALLATTLVAAPALPLATFMPAAARPAVGHRGRRGRRALLDGSDRIGGTLEEPEYLADY